MTHSTPERIWPGVALFAFTGVYLVLDQLYTPDYIAGGLIVKLWYSGWIGVWLLVSAVGFTAGYLHDFPRWSYAYTGLFVFTSLISQSINTSFPLIFIPLVVLGICLLVGLAARRSLRPLGRLFTNLGGDASQLSFALYASFPVLVLLLYRDMREPYFLVNVSLLAILMLATAWFYLRARTIWRRSAALALGLLAAIPIFYAEVLIPSLGGSLTPPELAGAVSLMLGYFVFVLLPAVLGCLHDLFEPQSTAQTELPQ